MRKLTVVALTLVALSNACVPFVPAADEGGTRYRHPGYCMASTESCSRGHRGFR